MNDQATAIAAPKADGAPRYQAERAADGTWTIYGVPVFSEHQEELPNGKVRIFSREWLAGALARAQTRQAEGYYAPAHVRHHSFGRSDVLESQVEAAGKVRFSHLGDLVLGGKPTATIFADLVGIKPEVYDRIRRGELSYRSVEVLKPSEMEIDSLAFLDHEVPFFRYPLLRVAEGKDEATLTEPADSTALTTGAGRAFHTRTDGSLAVLFSYRDREKEGALTEPTSQAQSSAPTAATATADDPAARMDPSGMQPGGAPQGGGELLQLLKAIAAKLGVGGGAPAAAPSASSMAGPPPMQQPMAPPMQRASSPVEVGSPGASYAAEASATDGPLAFEVTATGDSPAALTAARRDGELAALRSRLEAVEARAAKAEADARVAAFSAQLRERGFNERQVQSYVERAQRDGEAAGRAYAEGMLANGPQEPPSSWTGDLGSAISDPDEVAVYAQRGPGALARARELAASHRRVSSELPLATYLEINMDPALAGEE